jgi:DNA-binding transcriptional MocR family regulator
MNTLTLSQTLAASIERQIEEGAFKTGDRLPSLRDIADTHSYSKNTVAGAFEILVSKGLVEPRRGSGYYVLGKAGRQADEEPGGFSRAMDIVWLMREQLKSEPGVLSVGDGYPPVEWLQESRLDKYYHKVVRTGLGALFRYGSRFGYLPLRQHLIHKLANLGIEAELKQIVLMHGANQAMDMVIRRFVSPGTPVLVDDPGYYPLFGKLKFAGANVVGVPRLPDGPDLEALDQLCEEHRPRLFFTQSVAHNPTGTDITAAKAFRLLQLAQKHDLTVVENDPFADYKPASSPRIASLDHLERTIYVGSFSKSFSAALRVGFVACSADLASDLADIKALTHVTSSELSERTVDVILNEQHFERYTAALRQRLGDATTKAVQLFDDIGAEVFARRPESMYLWAALPGVDDSAEFAEKMLEHKIVMAPGRIFRVDSSVKTKWARYNVGAVLDPRFAQALKELLPKR